MKIFTKRGISFFLKSIVPMVFLVLFFVWSALGQNQELRITPGTYTFTVPAGVTSITVEAWGGGGRGGSWSGNGAGNQGSGGGGGGGAYSRSVLNVTPGQILSYTVGTGSNSADPGGDTYFGSTSTILAKGGQSSGPNSSIGGQGGVAAQGFGNVRYSGGNGADGSGTTYGGGGGSSSGSGANGVNGNNQNGGVAPLAGGNGGNGRSASDGNGNQGFNPGGGGGGSRKGNNTNRLGGNGANGQIKVSWCTITLTSAPETTNQSGICIGNPITPITYSITGASTVSFSGLPDGVSGSINSEIITISGTPTEAGLKNYTVTITNGNCIGTELTGTIRVDPENQAGTINQNTFCRNSPLPADVIQPTNGATGIGTATGLPAGITASFDNNQIVFSGEPSQTGVFNYSIPLNGGCGTISAEGTITINEEVAIVNPILDGQNSCPGTPFNPISVGEGFGLTYQWYSNTTASNSGGTPISGANSNSFTPPSTTTGITYYYVQVSGPCGASVNSQASGAFVVDPGNSVSSASSSPVACINSAIANITHTTTVATGIANGGVPGANGLPAGLSATWSGNQITISGIPTESGIFNYSIPLTGGCGTIAATGTITVNAQPGIPSQNTAEQETCLNSPFSTISVTPLTGLTYQWYSNTTAAASGGTLINGATSHEFTPPADTVGDRYYYVVATGPCGSSVTSAVSGRQRVNALPVPAYTAQPPSGNVCVDENLTYTVAPGQSNYVWNLPGAAGTDYAIISGGSPTDNSITIQWRTPGNKSLSVNYTDSNGCTALSAVSSNTVNARINSFTPSVPLNPSVCVDTPLSPVTINTNLATGIGTPVGLPPGVTAGFSSGTITLSGTPTQPGTYNYSIPLTGGCGTVNATGTMTVTPVYELTSIASVSPSFPGGPATVTIRGTTANLPNGTYTITYSLGLANSGTFSATVTVSNGRGTFTTVGISDPDLTSLEILTIRRATDACTINLTDKNITFFGTCAAVYDESGTFSFFVPAGINEITVKAWGGGGKGGNGNNGSGGGGGGYSTRTAIPVTPGDLITVVVGERGNDNNPNGGNTYLTRNPNSPDPQTTSLIFAGGGQGAVGNTIGQGGIFDPRYSGENGQNGQIRNVTFNGNGGNGGGTSGGAGGLGKTSGGAGRGGAGTAPGGGGGGTNHVNSNGGLGGDGLIIISYSCPPIDPNGCFNVLDDGSKSGATIIEFLCDSDWIAPEGLADFDVVAIGAGGGGGMGNAAGGGGAGGLNTGYFSTTEEFGMPDGTTFNITVGQGGPGATTVNERGQNGQSSSLTGTIDGSGVSVSAQGGGGGGSYGSQAVANGGQGASGGGGGFYRPNLYEGLGGASQTATGFSGGRGRVSSNNSAAAGGGGGGAGNNGVDGRPAGAGQSFAGDGGSGRTYDLYGNIIFYGGGGGGTGYAFNGNPLRPGDGGNAPNGDQLGGNGVSNGTGQVGQGIGSGGGAGTSGGGNGGPGRVFIIYSNIRILPVEFLYFKADYNTNKREATLNWATAKEWENSHFEIERSITGIKGFEKIGEKEGMGWTDQITEYQYIDQQLPLGSHNVLYRLKQVDFSGEFQYSDVVSLRLPGVTFTHGVWRAYPNPTNGSKLRISLMDRSQYEAERLSFKIIHPMFVTPSKTVDTEDEMNQLLEQLALKVPKGVFVVEIQWGQKVEHIKVLKQLQ